MKIKTMLCLLLCLLCAGCAAAEEKTYEPLPYSFEAAPYAPKAEGYLPDKAGYVDDSIEVRIEKGREFDTDYMAIHIKLDDPSQIRSGLAGDHPSKTTATVLTMANRFGGVLTINGDYFNYHTNGIIVRNGEELRFRPSKYRDSLIIDDKGDFTILPSCTKEVYESFTGNVMHAFCFGPWLVKDGVAINHDQVQASEVDIGKNKQTQRLALCQVDTLHYMVVCTEGPSGGDSSTGVTIEQMAILCRDLGAKQAYNLDGGNSAAVILNGEKLNNVANTKKRMIGDCIYFCTLIPD